MPVCGLLYEMCKANSSSTCLLVNSSTLRKNLQKNFVRMVLFVNFAKIRAHKTH